MTASGLLRWQWEGYSRYHQSRLNLQLHIVLVPLFLVSNVAFLVAILQRSWLVGIIAAATTILSIAIQGGYEHTT